MVDSNSSLLLVHSQQKAEVHGGSHLREASIEANHDETRSHAARSHAFDHKLYETEKLKSKKLKITRDQLDLAENRENVACMKPFGETDVLEQYLVQGQCKF